MDNKYYGYPYEEYINKSLYNISDKFKIPRNEGFYHYAPADAVRSILQHKEQTYTMWASHLSFLNDREEFENGEKLIFEVLNNFISNSLLVEQIENNNLFKQIVGDFLDAAQGADKDICINGEVIFDRNIYILCFCLEKNSLNQWKYYGKESGVALEFDLRKCEYSGVDCNYKDVSVFPKVYRVIYDDRMKRIILHEYVEKIYNAFLGGSEDRQRNLLHSLANMYELCPLFKHKDFHDEKECRLIFRPLYSYSENQNDVRNLVKYRKRAGILLPYMEIKMHAKRDCEYPEPLIKNIIIGPGENQDLLFRSMRHFALYTGVFDDYVKENVSIQKIVDEHIIKSETPFRG